MLGLCQRLAGLRLKFTKCWCVPLGGPLDEARRAAVLQCLVDADAAWAAFGVASNLVYLGFLLGVDVDLESQWAPQLAAWSERAGAIAKSGTCAPLLLLFI